jgi:DNA-directed RNA polymerase alpha subunit
MITQEQYHEALKIVNDYLYQSKGLTTIVTEITEPQFPINDIPRKYLTYRAYNVLKEKLKIHFLSQLEGRTKSDLFKYRSLGHKTFDDIKSCCDVYGITLIDDSVEVNNNI